MIHLPCTGCGAPLSLDIERGATRCAHCDLHQSLSAPVLTRVRAHLAVLSNLEARGEMALEDAATYRRLGSSWRGFLVAILINVVMVGGGWALFWAHGQLARAMGSVPATLAMIPLGLAAVIGLTWAWVAVFQRRKKARAALAKVEVEVARCTHCRASVPVAIGRQRRCPFCEAQLVASPAVSERVEAAARQEIERLEAEAALERDDYHEKVTRQTNTGRNFATIWGGICIGSLVGTPLIFVFENWGVPEKLQVLGVLPGAALGLGIALLLNHRR